MVPRTQFVIGRQIHRDVRKKKDIHDIFGNRVRNTG